jgi:hypothetical protein
VASKADQGIVEQMAAYGPIFTPIGAFIADVVERYKSRIERFPGGIRVINLKYVRAGRGSIHDDENSTGGTSVI